MTSTTAPNRHPALPADPRFYEAVLDLVPTPILVVNRDGRVSYGNQALLELSGWTYDDGIGLQMLDAIHPDDLPSVLDAYQSVVEVADAHETTQPWLPIRFRMVAKDGRIIPMEATGVGALGDGAVDGIVYHVRNCRDDELLADVFAGVASHDPVARGCAPLVERLALPPHAMAVAVFEQHANGSAHCIVASDDVVAKLPATSASPVPWAGLSTEPTRSELSTLPPDIAATLRQAGFGAVFHAGAHAPDFDTTLRLVACTPAEHASVQGPISQITQARELLSLIATKAHNDRAIASNAMRDDLTGLPNRLGLSHRFERIKATADDCAVMFVDIDRFKPINDELGHAAGDHVLATVADRLVRAVRPDDFVSRLGGDEFVIVLTDAAGRLSNTVVHHMADRIVSILSEPFTWEGETVQLGASVGVALGSHRELDDLIAVADGAMYRAKRAGGDRHHVSVDSAA